MIKKSMRILTFGILIVIILFETSIYFHTNLSQETIFSIVEYNFDKNRLNIKYRLSSECYPLDIQIAVLSYKNKKELKDKKIYIYYDPDYQMAGVTRKQARGLVDHLFAELIIRGYKGEIYVINASDLKKLLLDYHLANESILIITTGAFPDTVYTLNKNLVKPWIEAGGTLFWVGDYFGYYSAKKSKEKLDWKDTRHPKRNASFIFFGIKNVIVPLGWGTMAFADSKYSKALGLSYPYISKGVNIKVVKLLGGKVLGKIGKVSTSIAELPLGKGKIIIFGGEMGDERIVARDMAQIIVSGVLECDDIIYIKKNHLERYEEIMDSINISIKEYSSFVIYVFQVGDEPVIFTRISLPSVAKKAPSERAEMN